MTKVGSASAVAGAIAKGELLLGEYPDGGAASCPVAIAQGRNYGPVLWVQACVHGSEGGGIVGMHRVLRQLDLQTLKGAIVFAAVSNPFGFRANQRLTPQDGRNLNRAFPGSASGDVTDRIAHRLFTEASAVADAVIDLHTGGDYVIASHYMIYRDDGSDAGKISARLARSSGVGKMWNAAPDVFAGAAYLEFVRSGTPAVLFECGGGGQVTPRDLDRFEQAVLGCCRALGMLPGGPERGASSYLYGGGHATLRASRGGFFVPTGEAGDLYKEGDEIGTTADVFGERLEVLRSPFKLAWVASMRRPYLPVFAGDDLAVMIEVIHS